ncbi:hypothetical protein [Corallococcus exiguus]|uniref:hypothetical protein n=1 Tax=Corallococcus exiguus TaxID=83462 RepID=UPI001561854F|nr:hypothetical protein [Corallococcus exiguus]NRD58967.1 hypothetical protein [Corallococcus exiguus]
MATPRGLHRAAVGGAGLHGPAHRGLCIVTVTRRHLELRHSSCARSMAPLGWRSPEGFH